MIRIPLNRDRIKSSIIKVHSPDLKHRIEELSESESIDTFTSSDSSSSSSEKSRIKRPFKKKKFKRSKSFAAGMSIENDQNNIPGNGLMGINAPNNNHFKNIFVKNHSIITGTESEEEKVQNFEENKEFKLDRHLKFQSFHKMSIQPASRIKSLRHSSAVQNNFIHDDSKSWISSEIIEENEDESLESGSFSEQSENKSSSEFDINKSVHTSQDHSSNNHSVDNTPTMTKTADKRGTSTSTKEFKKNKNSAIIESLLAPRSKARDSSSSADFKNKNKRFSQISSVFSHTSKGTDKIHENKKESGDKIKESKVSIKFSEQTTKRVVFLVLLVVMAEFVFLTNTYVDPLTSYSYAIDALSSLGNETNLNSTFDFIANYHSDDTDYRILRISYKMPNGESSEVEFDNPRKYREQEIEKVSSGDFTMHVILRPELRFEAYLSLGKTTFILFIIMASALLISRDATALVLQPLETIMFKVNEMAEDPFQILKFNEIEAMVDDEKDKKSKDKNALYETMILDDAITKIGTLLLLGFGEAGSSLLSNHINKGETLDPKSTRKKTLAIYGF